MRLIQVCNNYAQSDDGIGNYVATIVGALERDNRITIISARCPASLSYIKRIRERGMTAAVKNLLDKKEELLKSDALILDYPFVELNPLFLLTYSQLSKCARMNRIPLILSLHEYERCNLIRKKYIQYMTKKSDALLVTTQEMAVDLSRYVNIKNIYIRPIASNVRIKAKKVAKKSNYFTYFGMVNKSKAFSEMLEAWSMAGPAEGELGVITASNVTNVVEAVRGTRMYYNATEDIVSSVLQESAFCILPILPEVDQKNTSFISAINAGCICIGKFCDEFSQLPFVVNLSDYSPGTLAKAIGKAASFEKKEIERLSLLSREYAKRFSTEFVAEQYSTTISSIIKRYRKIHMD